MNYIAEIKVFQGLAQDKCLSTGQIALWYALMYINNKCFWEEWFTVANLSLQLNSGLSKDGIRTARNVLKQYEIIDFKSNGTKATSYKIIPRSDLRRVDTLIDTRVDTRVDTLIDTPLNKLNKTKLNKSNKVHCPLGTEIPKVEKTKIRFIKPSLDEIREYCIERKNSIDAEHFYDYYETIGWFVGKKTMKNWQAAIRTWEKSDFKNGGDKNNADNRARANKPVQSKENDPYDIIETIEV